MTKDRIQALLIFLGALAEASTSYENKDLR
jgi:hypothetical protein